MLHLDYVSCLLTILSTILIGKRLWYDWVIAAINSLVICIIGVQTAQYGFVPGNLLCIVLYAHNLLNWRLGVQREAALLADTLLPSGKLTRGAESELLNTEE